MNISERRDDLLLFAQIALGLFTLIGTLLLSADDKPAAAFAAVGLGSMLLLRFGDIASLSLKAFGAEAVVERAQRAASEADKAAEDAVKAIEALKQTGMNLSSAVLLLQTLVGQGGKVTIAGVVDLRRTIVKDLQALGCTPAQIDEVMEMPDHVTVITMVNEATSAMRADHAASIRPLLSPLMMRPPINLSRVKAVFAEYEVSDRAEKWLAEAENFQKAGEVDLKKIEPY